MAAIREALEPGEIVPFGYQYQSDELEPGEIRPYTVTAAWPVQAPVYHHEVRRVQLLRMQQFCWDNRVHIQPVGVPVVQHVPQVSSHVPPQLNVQQSPVKPQEQNWKIKRLQGVLSDLKNTLASERQEFAVQLRRQSRKIRAFEIKEKQHQDEIKELKNAKDVAEDTVKKTDEEKEALSAMMRSLEKEGCKLNRRLQQSEAELSKFQRMDTGDKTLKNQNAELQGKCKEHLEAERVLQAKCKELQEAERVLQAKCKEHQEAERDLQAKCKELLEAERDTVHTLQSDKASLRKKITLLEKKYAVLEVESKKFQDDSCQFQAESRAANAELQEITNRNAETINELEDQVGYYRSAHEKTTKKSRKITQQSESWRNKFRESQEECKRAQNEKATLSHKIKSLKNRCCRRGKIIETEKAANAELRGNIKTLKKELKTMQRRARLLSEENRVLRHENYNLRYYSGIVGGFRRVKQFFVRLADRLLP